MAFLSVSVSPFSGQSFLSFRTRNQPVHCANERQVLFNRIAPVYDNLNDLLSLGQHRIWKRMAVSWSGASKGDCVLDLCCGSGDLAFLLSNKIGPEGKVTGLDFSKDQLLVASSRQELQWNAWYNNIMWMEGDAHDLPFPESYFDAITVGYGLRNLVDKPKAMKEMFRVLKPGSRVSILDFNKSTQPFTTLIQIVEEGHDYETMKQIVSIAYKIVSPSFRAFNIIPTVCILLEWMIDNVVVPVASSYSLAKEYEYLKSSIREFLTGRELEKLALEVGFSNAKHYEIGGGLMGNLVATR